MCDYSLHTVSNRPAQVGDKLILSCFPNTFTRGFSEVGKPDTAVCLRPGTEIAFDESVRHSHGLLQRLAEVMSLPIGSSQVPHRLGRFRQINLDVPNVHHDAIEFPDGKILLITRLRTGLRATVLQLPVDPSLSSGDNRPSRKTVTPESDGEARQITPTHFALRM